jgi:hypothetical protein
MGGEETAVFSVRVCVRGDGLADVGTRG